MSACRFVLPSQQVNCCCFAACLPTDTWRLQARTFNSGPVRGLVNCLPSWFDKPVSVDNTIVMCVFWQCETAFGAPVNLGHRTFCRDSSNVTSPSGSQVYDCGYTGQVRTVCRLRLTFTLFDGCCVMTAILWQFVTINWECLPLTVTEYRVSSNCRLSRSSLWQSFGCTCRWLWHYY